MEVDGVQQVPVRLQREGLVRLAVLGRVRNAQGQTVGVIGALAGVLQRLAAIAPPAQGLEAGVGRPAVAWIGAPGRPDGPVHRLDPDLGAQAVELEPLNQGVALGRLYVDQGDIGLAAPGGDHEQVEQVFALGRQQQGGAHLARRHALDIVAEQVVEERPPALALDGDQGAAGQMDEHG